MAAPRGGKRANAGRPKGSTTKRKREVARRAAADGLSPIEVMLKAMREHAALKEWAEAAKYAQMAAPYIHPRLQAIQHTGKEGGPIEVADMSRNDLARRILHMLRPEKP